MRVRVEEAVPKAKASGRELNKSALALMRTMCHLGETRADHKGSSHLISAQALTDGGGGKHFDHHQQAQ